MPKSYRIRTEVGKDKFLQVKLDQDYDKLELLSLAIFPNEVYTRDCAEFGVLCGRVFSNRGLGVENARVSIFIPLQREDETNPIISTLYPYRTFEQFNEDGYKYNLLPYTQSHSGHVPVGTFPERTDALTNKSVIEVYDKYYKFTAKTNSAGDYMIFGIPIGQHEIFMQVDLSDIGEFSLTPQDLLRSGRATEAQLDGTNFKFSENYSELPQIVTITKTVQIAPFYGQKEICDYYITRADFDLTLEAFIEIQPTAVFMGSIISTAERKKLKKNCKVPPKQGWLCDLVTGRGMIETVRQTVNIGNDGRPILELFTLEKDGKVIDENGAWLIELPMNLDYVYTDEFGVRQISPDGSKGVPTKGKYRFKVKWNQSTFLSEENKRAYFLVPNVKEWGWEDSNNDPNLSNIGETTITLATNQNEKILSLNDENYYVLEKTTNIQEYKIYSSSDGTEWTERPEYQSIIPFKDLYNADQNIEIKVVYTLIDSSNPDNDGKLIYKRYDTTGFQILASYAFSLSWLEYGTTDMINEALACQDRFYNFEYNKVYTVSSFLDRYTSGGINLYLPQRTIQIKNITDNNCEGNYNRFPTNDAYYRYDFIFIIISAILTFFKFVLVPLIIVLHFLAFMWPILKILLWIVNLIYGLIVLICNAINALTSLFNLDLNCPDWEWNSYSTNPFKNVKLPLLLSSDDGCSLCKCNIGDVDLNDNEYASALANFLGQINIRNVSNLSNLTSASGYINMENNAYSAYTSGYGAAHVDAAGGGTNSEPLSLSVFAAGNAVNDEYAQRIGHWRLPIFGVAEGNEGLAGTDRYFDSVSIGISTQLTLGERVNLFNTKAKYFDRDSTNTFANSLNGGSLSPGDIGWNQIKVQFFSNIPSNGGTFHHDNVIVLICDSSGLTTGDLVSFSNPKDSEDPNYRNSFGKINLPGLGGSFEVKFANPTYGQGNSTVDYYTSWTPPFNQVGQIINFPSSTGTTCYPADLEYFQVIHTETIQQYRAKRAPLQPTGNNRYSLPWRFLDSSYVGQSQGADYKTGYRGTDLQELLWTERGSTFNELPNDSPINNPGDYFNNSMMFMRIMNPPYGPGYDGYNGWYGSTVHCNLHENYPILNPNIEVTNAQAGVIGNTNTYKNFNTYWDVWSHLTGETYVVFLVRGVDVHSGRYPVKYDLSRLYGYENYEQQGLQVEGDSFFLNIPIQAWDDTGDNSPNRNGLKLPRHYLFGDNNPNTTNRGGSIFYKPYFWEYFTSTSPEVINDEEGVIIPYDPNWRTINHLYYSSLDSLIADNGWALNNQYSQNGFSHSGETPIWGTMNRQAFSDDVVISDTANFFGVSWHRRTLGTNFNTRNLNTANCTSSNYYCSSNGSAEIAGYPRPNIDFATQNLSSKIYGTTFSTVANPFYNCFHINRCADGQGICQIGSACLSSGQRERQVFCDPVWGGLGGGSCTGPFGNEQNQYLISLLPPNWWDRSICDYSSDWWDWWCSTGLGYESGSGYGNGRCYLNSVKGWNTKYQWVFHGHRDNYEMNHVGGIFHGEYVEGGSIMTSNFYRSNYKIAMNSWRTDYSNSVSNITPYGRADYYGNFDTAGGVAYNNNTYFLTNSWPYGEGGAMGDYTAWTPFNMKYKLEQDKTTYISPVYSEMTNPINTSCYIALDSKDQNGNNYYFQNILMSDRTGLVFRSDRLPSSDRPNGLDALPGSGFLIHQNPGFRIFKTVGDEQTICPPFTGFGGGNAAQNVQTNEPDNSLVEGSNIDDDVIQSTVDCAKAVDLNSYTINSNGQPDILPKGPWSKDGKYLWFQRGEGCYNTVSRPILSMLTRDIPDDNTQSTKKYSDIITVVEWVQRIKLTLAACFDIFSHTFSNNWINGTLYAFPFQLSTRFDANNVVSTRTYCKDTIYFNETINNFFYRSSPYNGNTNKFIGKTRLEEINENTGGNIKNLLFPTTVMDLGPKNKYIQELVNSDVYDGYIADKIPSTTFQNVETFLNIFILSRLINSKFIELLIPSAKFGGGNDTEGNDDPSVGAFFQNKRWSNGNLFKVGSLTLPGLIDGDYAQMISINSEIGILEFDPNNYSNSDVFIGINGTNNLTDYPWFGVILSGDNQWRDYISPRRKFYSENGNLSNVNQFSTQIPGINYQNIPLYFWEDKFVDSNSIFGHQNNNFVTNELDFFQIGYQEFDRIFSRYFQPEDNYTKTRKGYIAKYIATTNVNSEVVLIPDELSTNNLVTLNNNGKILVGAPFHFYFGLIQGSSAMDLFINKYVDTTVVND